MISLDEKWNLEKCELSKINIHDSNKEIEIGYYINNYLTIGELKLKVKLQNYKRRTFIFFSFQFFKDFFIPINDQTWYIGDYFCDDADFIGVRRLNSNNCNIKLYISDSLTDYLLKIKN